MKEKWKAYSKWKKVSLIAVLALVILSIMCVVGFVAYASIYYHADDTAVTMYDEGIENGSIMILDNITIIEPEESNGVGIIFYPGAKVEAIAYIPILQQLADEGFSVVLMEMPFNMAIFDVDAANDVFELIEDVESGVVVYEEMNNLEVLVAVEEWYMMGHSMGGAMASSYASDNQEILEGLILIGAYVYGGYPVESALTIYGTFNDNLEENIDYTENIVIIEGGNHAQYGNYGKQDGDPDATISDVEQQAITVEAILEFIFS